MSKQEKRASERVPIALRIRLRYGARDPFISKFAINISRGGMFLSSRNPKPPGTEVHFEIFLVDDSPAITGSGEVRWIREYQRSRPDQLHGMGIRFISLASDGRQVLDRILADRTPSEAVLAAAPVASEAAPARSKNGHEPSVVRAAVGRARALTSEAHGDGELDRELIQLLDAPTALGDVTVDAASRELADRLGGTAVTARRGRLSD